MRITIVLGPFIPPPPAGCGAVELLWTQLAHRFADMGHSVTVVCRTWPGDKDEIHRGVRYVRRGGFERSRRVALDLLKDAWYSLRLWPALPRADVIVANCFWMPVLLSVLQRIPLLSRGKAVVNLARMPKGQLALYRFTSRIAATSSAVVSEAVRQSPGLSDLVKVLPNPIDTVAFARPAGALPQDGPPVVLYTGRIHPEKGLELLVRACGLVVRGGCALRLRLVGPSARAQGGGGEDFVNELVRLASECGVNLELRPPLVDRAALASQIWASTVYCYPSLADKGESFGVAPLEAMAAGVAPVVSDLACFRDFVEHGRNSLVFDHRSETSAENLAQAIRQLLQSPELVASLGIAACKTAQRFSIESVADQFLADFSTITGLPARPPAGGVAGATSTKHHP